MHLVQILLPVTDNAGEPFAHAHFRAVREELVQHFGGVTAYTQAPAEGRWKDDDDTVERDQIVVFEVMADDLDRPWWTRYRATLERRFAQDEIVLRSWPMERL